MRTALSCPSKKKLKHLTMAFVALSAVSLIGCGGETKEDKAAATMSTDDKVKKIQASNMSQGQKDAAISQLKSSAGSSSSDAAK